MCVASAGDQPGTVRRSPRLPAGRGPLRVPSSRAVGQGCCRVYPGSAFGERGPGLRDRHFFVKPLYNGGKDGSINIASSLFRPRRSLVSDRRGFCCAIACFGLLRRATRRSTHRFDGRAANCAPGRAIGASDEKGLMTRVVSPAGRVALSLEGRAPLRPPFWSSLRPPSVAFAHRGSVAAVSPIAGHDGAWPFRASDG